MPEREAPAAANRRVVKTVEGIPPEAVAANRRVVKTVEGIPPEAVATTLRDRYWIERIKDAELIDARFGLVIPGDSALASVFNSMEEAAYAGEPEFDPRVQS